MPRSLKVVHLLHSGIVGGGLRVVLDLITRVPAEHTVIGGDDGPLLADVAAHGVPAVRLPFAGKVSFTASLPLLVRAFRGADLVHLHGQFAGFYGTAAASLAGVPAIYTAHFPSFLTDSNLRTRLRNHVAEAVTCRLASVVVACSETNRQEYLARRLISSSRIVTIYNGVSVGRPSIRPDALRTELGLDEEDHVVLAIGRLADQKGFDVLLDAAPAVLEAVPAARFVVVGDGPRRHDLERQARTLGVEAAVRFTGIRRDPENYLQLAAVVAAPSRYESSGLAVLEAMMAERPVVASALPVLQEAVDDGRTGVLVPLAPGPLSSALASLLRDPERRCAMGRRAGQEAEVRFSAARMAADYAALYHAVAASRS